MLGWRGLVSSTLRVDVSGVFCGISSFGGGKTLVSLPLLSYTDLSLKQAMQLSASLTSRHQIRVLADELEPNTDDMVVSRLSLEKRSIASIWSNSLTSEARNRVRRADKAGLEISNGSGQRDIDDFYCLYLVNQHRHGSPTLPKCFFERLVETFDVEILNIKRGHLALSSALLIRDGGLAWVPWLSNTAEARRYWSSDFIIWKMIELEKTTSRSNLIDLGRSRFGGGVYRFKSKWGCNHLKLLTVGSSHSNIYEKYRFAQSMWKRIPLSLASRVSNLIIHRIPDL